MQIYVQNLFNADREQDKDGDSQVFVFFPKPWLGHRLRLGLRYKFFGEGCIFQTEPEAQAQAEGW